MDCQNLIYTIAIDPPNSSGNRTLAKMLASSLLRTFFTPSPVAYLNNPAKATALFGNPTVAFDTMLTETAHWLKSNLPSHNKPTHFQAQDGNY